jgi:hypothetical protein
VVLIQKYAISVKMIFLQNVEHGACAKSAFSFWFDVDTVEILQL